MANENLGKCISCKAGDTISAYRCVYVSTAPSWVRPIATSASAILGVSTELADDTGVAINIVLNGIAKLEINDSITAGNVVAPGTAAAGKIVAVAINTTTALLPTLGIALEGASTTGAIISIALQISNTQLK